MKEKIKRVVKSAYKKTLGLTSIEVETNFFDIGGDSLSAINCATIIEKKLKVPIPLARLMSDTLEELCDFILSNR